MKSFSSSMVIRLLRKRGWYEVACVGDHHQFKHLSIPGRITIPHPKKNLYQLEQLGLSSSRQVLMSIIGS